MHLQCLARNEPGTQFRQLSFSFATEMSKQIFCDNELEDSITKKFQTLIIKMITLRLVADAGMRERLGKQKRIAEFVTDAFLQRTHVFVILSESEESLNSV